MHWRIYAALGRDELGDRNSWNKKRCELIQRGCFITRSITPVYLQLKPTASGKLNKERNLRRHS